MTDDPAAIDPARLEMRFLGFLAKIFSDGVVTDDERNELVTRIASRDLTAEQIRKVMLRFLETSAKHVTADGVVTDRERARLGTIIRELGLPDDALPDEVRRALAR